MGRELLFGSRHVESPRAAEVIDPHQVLKQPLGDLFGIEAILEHAIGTRDGDDGQTIRLILAADHSLGQYADPGPLHAALGALLDRADAP